MRDVNECVSDKCEAGRAEHVTIRASKARLTVDPRLPSRSNKHKICKTPVLSGEISCIIIYL